MKIVKPFLRAAAWTSPAWGAFCAVALADGMHVALAAVFPVGLAAFGLLCAWALMEFGA